MYPCQKKKKNCVPRNKEFINPPKHKNYTKLHQKLSKKSNEIRKNQWAQQFLSINMGAKININREKKHSLDITTYTLIKKRIDLPN